MGCRPSSQVRINLDRTNVSYIAGEVVSGNVQLLVIDSNLDVDQIDLNLTGELGYSTKQNSTVNGKATTRTIHHNVPFLTKNQVLVRPDPGKKELAFPKGEYSWPFQIQLPDHVPPSIGNPQTYPHVRFYVQVLIDKAWYKSDSAQNRYILVRPRISLTSQPNCLPSVFGNHNRKDIALKGRLNKLGFSPGEPIHVTMEIENPRRALIKQITVTMIKNMRMGPWSNEHTMLTRIIPEIMRRSEERLAETFDVIIPPGPIAPSCQYQGGLRQVVEINVSYVLKFDVNVDGIFDDFVMLAPFVIGNESSPQQ